MGHRNFASAVLGMPRYFLYPDEHMDFVEHICGCVCCPMAKADAGERPQAAVMRATFVDSRDHRLLASWTTLTILQLVTLMTNQPILVASRPAMTLLLLLLQPMPLPGCLLYSCPYLAHPSVVVEPHLLVEAVPLGVEASLALCDRRQPNMVLAVAIQVAHAQ